MIWDPRSAPFPIVFRPFVNVFMIFGCRFGLLLGQIQFTRQVAGTSLFPRKLLFFLGLALGIDFGLIFMVFWLDFVRSFMKFGPILEHLALFSFFLDPFQGPFRSVTCHLSIFCHVWTRRARDTSSEHAYTWDRAARAWRAHRGGEPGRGLADPRDGPGRLGELSTRPDRYFDHKILEFAVFAGENPPFRGTHATFSIEVRGSERNVLKSRYELLRSREDSW